MALILTRSPYFIDCKDYDDGALLKVEVGNTSLSTIYETYTVNFRNSKLIDISPLVNDYFTQDNYEWLTTGSGSAYTGTASIIELGVRTTLSGEKSGVAQPDIIETHVATQGYLYSTDPYNGVVDSFSGATMYSLLEENAYYAGSSDIVYKLDDHNLRLPIFGGSVDVVYMNKGEVVEIGNAVSSGESYLSRVMNSNFIDRPTVESHYCIDKFFRLNVMEDIDKVLISNSGGYVKTIEVVTKSECKYKPYRVTFKNRWGVNEDLWFFKRSFTEMSVEKESYRSNSIKAYNAGYFGNSTDSIKTFVDFNVNARERITLNSDWVDERLNESFRQLMLSEEITLYDFSTDKTYNVNILTSDLRFKDHITDKVINYEVQFEFAHEVINNVG
jgi:hypothetical protein